jgi:2-polyprenyl-3-methyl-5-hydroxy-6-metoxy-1,4-benzoquinol methylase
MQPASDPAPNPWDEQAPAYAGWVARRYPADPAAAAAEPLPGRVLALLGDVAGREVLDACCGEGFFSRLLAARGARVTGIDLSPRLIELARAQGPPGTTYRVADLSRPLPELAGRFDAVASYMGLNDVADHRGFASTLVALAKPGGRAVLALNNPYSFLVRGEGHVTDYFASGARGVYGGLSAQLGASVRYYHRTLEEYLDALLAAGLRLGKLADVPSGSRGGIPSYMILAFDKP